MEVGLFTTEIFQIIPFFDNKNELSEIDMISLHHKVVLFLEIQAMNLNWPSITLFFN